MAKTIKTFTKRGGVMLILLLFFIMIGVHSACNETAKENIELLDQELSIDGVVNGVDTLTGLAYDDTFEIVRANCITCHSSKLITQNRATREGWKGMLDWMKETQNLPDLGDNEGPILDYLAKHYAPENKGRRLNLDEIEWYVLGEEE